MLERAPIGARVLHISSRAAAEAAPEPKGQADEEAAQRWVQKAAGSFDIDMTSVESNHLTFLTVKTIQVMQSAAQSAGPLSLRQPVEERRNRAAGHLAGRLANG